jgi:hypothetical protein
MESAWRWFLIDLNHLGVMDAKWFLLAFAASTTASWAVTRRRLRRLEARNRYLRLLKDAADANDELERLGSPLNIDIPPR